MLAALTPKASQSSKETSERAVILVTVRSRSGVCVSVGRAAAWWSSTSFFVASRRVYPSPVTA